MKIVKVSPQKLGANDKLRLSIRGLTPERFVIIRHDHETIYLNERSGYAAYLEQAIADMFSVVLLDVPNEEGKDGFTILSEVAERTGRISADILLEIWQQEAIKRRKADAEAAAGAWMQSYDPTEEIPGLDTYFLNALYLAADKKYDRNYDKPGIRALDRRAALEVVYLHGFQNGQRMKEAEQNVKVFDV